MLKNLTIKLLITSILISFSSLLYSQTNDSLTIKVVSYNIQTGTHYQTDTPQKIAQFLDEWEIDIFSTQELHMPQVLLFENELENYGWFGVGRDNGKNLGETSVIFYHLDHFEVLEQNSFWLSETPEVPGSKSWNTSDTRIVTWGKFLIKSTSKVFYVFNTHYDHISSLARSESSKLLRLKMREIAGLNPIIITGDLNCSFGSTPYDLLIEDNPEDLKIFDSEKISLTEPFGPTGSYNNFSNDNPTNKIDFIFVNQYLKTLTCGIINEKPDGEFISDHFPVFAELLFEFPTAPIMPTLTAIAGDNQVNLSWDNISELNTYEPFLIEDNDFQGYKLYKSRDPEMKDAELVPGSWNVPLLRKPLMVSDKIDNISGYTNYGIINGYGYFLGDNTGLQHFYTDYDVINGENYFYLLTAYDYGNNEVGSGFAPNESTFEIVVDNDGKLVSHTRNVAVAVPNKQEDNSIIPTVEKSSADLTLGNAKITLDVFNSLNTIEDAKYKLLFDVDTLSYLETNSKYRHPHDLLYINNGFKIVSVDNDSLIYSETKDSYTGNNIVYDNIESFYYINSEKQIVTEEFEGLQLKLDYHSITGQFSAAKSGWIIGDSKVKVLVSENESAYFPWEYEIVFTDNNEEYTGLTNKVKNFRSHDDLAIGPANLLLNQKFNFYVINKSFQLSDGTYEKLDLVVYDKDMDGTFNRQIDQILVGHCSTLANQILWNGTVFALDYSEIEDENNLPKPGDKYIVDFDRPFMDSDEILFTVKPNDGSINSIENESVPEEFSLEQNYPNPFNPTTNIKFQIAKSGKYTLKVYNLLGELVETIFNDFITTGSYIKNFSGRELSSGVYVYSLQGEGIRISRKMILIK